MTTVPTTLAAGLELTARANQRTPAGDERAADIETRRQQARAKAEEFESVFLNTFVEQMFSGIKTEGPFTGGSSEDIYRSMMSEQYAKSISKSGGIGLADHIYSEILKAQQIEP